MGDITNTDIEQKPEQHSSIKPATETRRDFFKRFKSLLPEPDNRTYTEIQSQNPDLMPSERNKMYQEIGRRNFLKRALYTTLGFVGLGLLAKFDMDNSVKPDKKDSDQTLSETTKKLEQNNNQTTEIFKLADANKILSLPPGSDDRKNAEKKYVNEVIALNNLKHLDQTLWFTTNTENRIRLLEERWKMRENGFWGLKKLEKKEEEFAKNNNFYPEWIAICIDSYVDAKKIIQKKINDSGGMVNFIKEFRPDLEGLVNPQKVTLGDIILPVGALIGIAWNESKYIKNNIVHALVNIGQLSAWDYIKVEKSEELGGVRNKFTDLGKLMSTDSMVYDPKKMPGSDTGDIGSVQFRPDTAFDYNVFLQKHFGFKFNPYGLEAVTAACLMLSIGHKWKNEKTKKDEYRLGWVSGGEKGSKQDLHRKTAMERWNKKSVENILEWNDKYIQAMK